jgi:uncharacterized protein YjbI with pentapeptide repeats
MKFEIKHRWTGAVLFTLETESLKLCVEAAIKSKANLTGADLARANLTGADLARADLADANLTQANLARANLADANLIWANLTDANLTQANLTQANLKQANLTGADLAGAGLARANLTQANLTNGVEFVQVSGIGSVRRSTVYRIDTDEVWCGCFHGTLEEFRAKVASSYPDGKHRVQYDAAIAFFAECNAAHEAK